MSKNIARGTRAESVWIVVAAIAATQFPLALGLFAAIVHHIQGV